MKVKESNLILGLNLFFVQPKEDEQEDEQEDEEEGKVNMSFNLSDIHWTFKRPVNSLMCDASQVKADEFSQNEEKEEEEDGRGSTEIQREVTAITSRDHSSRGCCYALH